MPQFDINVRAIVTATVTDRETPALIDGWEVYDHEFGEVDAEGATKVTICCDQSVRVEGTDLDDAVEAAKAIASAITLENHQIDEVKLWVDTDIDITPVPAFAP